MKDTIQNKIEARNLRKSGFSYREISIKMRAPKATIASWVQGVPLTDYQKTALATRLKLRQKQGRFLAGIALKARRIYREKVAYDQAEATFKTHFVESFFSYGLGLYSGKASKDETRTGGKNSSNFQYMTNDPDKAVLMYKWIENYLKIEKGSIRLRVFVYEPYRNAECEAFWARTMTIPLSKLSPTTYSQKHYFYKKKADYRGSIAITISNIHALRTVLAWQKLLIKYYKETSVESSAKGKTLLP